LGDETRVKSTLSGWYLGNLLIGVWWACCGRPLTGAMYTLPKEVSVNLNPRTEALSEEPELRVMYLEEFRLPADATHPIN